MYSFKFWKNARGQAEACPFSLKTAHRAVFRALEPCRIAGSRPTGAFALPSWPGHDLQRSKWRFMTSESGALAARYALEARPQQLALRLPRSTILAQAGSQAIQVKTHFVGGRIAPRPHRNAMRMVIACAMRGRPSRHR